MDILAKIFTSPFTWGLLVGFIFAAWAFCSGWSAKRTLRRQVGRLESQIAELKRNISTQVEVAANDRQTLRAENADLKQRVENLTISLATLQNKPGRAELRQLHLYDKAVHLMCERAPGFSPVWENALKEARAELDKTSIGLLPWLRRIIHPSLAPATPSLPPPDAPGDRPPDA
jgi:regulator of replication initiation timing